MRTSAIAIIAGFLFFGWLNREPIPRMANVQDMTPEQKKQVLKMLEVPILSPDEWEQACGKKWDWGPNDRGQNHCSLTVVVDCPPDCGVYKTLREDKLLRRIH